MQSIQSLPTFLESPVTSADAIPRLGHAEAGVLIREELTRFIQLVESLDANDWSQPTYCTEWNVREILAHQAGAYAGFASWKEFVRQNITNEYQKTEKEPIDGINRRQLEDREGRTPAELLAELKEVGPRAINTRQKLPALLRALPILPMGPPKGTMRVSYLTDEIYPRDTWSHRLDISAATGREMQLTPEHDGRLTALIVQDLAETLRPHLAGRSVVYEIVGPAGGTWQVGGGVPEAVITVKTLDFHLLASRRVNGEHALSELVTISGDLELAKLALEHTLVLY